MTIIFECKTTQVGPIKTTIDCLNSLLTDVNFKFTPHFLEENNDDSEYESESDEYDSDDSEENKKKESENTSTKNKKVGGIIIKEVNKTSSILVHCKLDADKFDYYYYGYKKSKLVIGVNLANILKCLKCMSNFDTMTWEVDDDNLNELCITFETKTKDRVESKNTIVKVTPKVILGENQEYKLYILGKTSEEIENNIPSYVDILAKNNTLSEKTIFDVRDSNDDFSTKVKSRGSYQPENFENDSNLNIKIIPFYRKISL